MLKNLFVGLGIGLFSLLTGIPAHAQEGATLALRSGERPSGELLDLNASGFILRVNGQERSFPASEVTTVEFAVGPVSREAQSRIDAGQPFVILRNGQIIDGRLSDVGGTRPLRLTIETPGGSRDIQSNEVAQIWVNPQARSAGGSAVQAPDPSNGVTITVPANVAWTDTGINVTSRLPLVFRATGDIMLAAGLSSGIGGSPAATAPGIRYPVPGAPAGALIGRVGNGRPFLIGANAQPIQMPNSGRLMLGVNDDHVADNSGNYSVTISR
jgi:hypothetical protein